MPKLPEKRGKGDTIHVRQGQTAVAEFGTDPNFDGTYASRKIKPKDLRV